MINVSEGNAGARHAHFANRLRIAAELVAFFVVNAGSTVTM